jgi:hypothetical protein
MASLGNSQNRVKKELDSSNPKVIEALAKVLGKADRNDSGVAKRA